VTGTIVQVNVSRGGIPKRAVASGELTEAGIAGDGWRFPFHGGQLKAVLLITAEGLDEVIAQGFALFPGALGENLTTRGIDRHALRLGQRLRVGRAVIELTRIRTPCSTLDVYGSGIQAALYDARVLAGDVSSPRWGLSGFYASVIQPGVVSAGDTIALLETHAHTRRNSPS
jgi:MOSC domain-containing protein YiiM